MIIYWYLNNYIDPWKNESDNYVKEAVKNKERPSLEEIRGGNSAVDENVDVEIDDEIVELGQSDGELRAFLVQLMIKCWDHDPQNRPEFEVIRGLIDSKIPKKIRLAKATEENNSKDKGKSVKRKSLRSEPVAIQSKVGKKRKSKVPSFLNSRKSEDDMYAAFGSINRRE
mgnify:CR=1 FL=1